MNIPKTTFVSQRISKSRKKSGQTLILALASLGVVTVVALAAPKISAILSKQSRAVRVKGALISAESEIRTQFFEPSNYKSSCFVSGANRSYANCYQGKNELRVLAAATRMRSIIGAQCPAGLNGCGIKVQVSEDLATKKIKFILTYEGLEAVVAPREFILDFGKIEKLTQCDSSQPWFEGLDTHGNARCKALPSCPPGQFLVGQNASNLQPLCATIDNNTLGCPTTQKISKITWLVTNNKLSAHINCVTH